MSVRQFSEPKLGVPLPSYGSLVFALVLVWGVGDAVSTLLAFGVGGSLQLEANPLMRALLAEHLLLLPLFKALVVGVVGGLLLSVRGPVESVPGWRLWFGSLLAVGVAVVATNLSVVFALAL
jgi:hypothetical protein